MNLFFLENALLIFFSFFFFLGGGGRKLAYNSPRPLYVTSVNPSTRKFTWGAIQIIIDANTVKEDGNL